MASGKRGDDQDWLVLLRAPGVGPIRYQRLIKTFGSPGQAQGASRAALEQSGLTAAAIDWLQRPDPDILARDLDWLQQPGNHLIRFGDACYPALLAQIPDPPPLLFVHGDPDLLSQPQLAIVGSRNPTSGGQETARDFARYLANRGLLITSGLAIGIDAAAHRGALDGGHTIAVAGTGPDRVYPAQHRDLARQIAAQGALVSELPPGTSVRREHFPRRNRLISGLAVGTLVVEAAERSGSLITARLAAEQGREVFAIPGSIHNPLARGCHRLIREGAKLVDQASDILEELAPLLGSLLQAPAPNGEAPAAAPNNAWDPDYQLLLRCLGHDPRPPDDLIECSGLAADVVSSMLLMLELEGYVTPAPGGRFSRTGKPGPGD